MKRNADCTMNRQAVVVTVAWTCQLVCALWIVADSHTFMAMKPRCILTIDYYRDPALKDGDNATDKCGAK